jgi:tetratricopeptide (TPR) repeat protein
VLTPRAAENHARIESYLQLVAPAAARTDPASPTAAEYQYRRLQLAQRAKDEAAAREAAAWLVEHATGTPYEMPALVVAAREADRAADEASAAERPTRAAAAAAIYARLVAKLGDSPAVLAKTKNALAAASKLAEYDEELGRTAEAAARLARIVEAFPTDKNYLRRAGLAHFAAADYAASLDCWRRLLGGVSPGSEAWLEAKFHQIACLLQTDRPTAEKVWRQFQLLYPEIKSPAWKDRFAELATQFS